MSESTSVFEAIRKRNEAFEEVHSGPTKNDFSISVDDSRGIAFEATQGMTREEFKEKNRQAVDKLFEQEEIGNVFEKDEPLKEKIEPISLDNNKTSSIGLDLDAIKNKLEKEDIKKEKEMNHGDMGMSGPSKISSMNFL